LILQRSFLYRASSFARTNAIIAALDDTTPTSKLAARGAPAEVTKASAMVTARSLSPAAAFGSRLGLVLAGSALMTISAQIAVPASPLWGVPFTLQTLAIPVLVALLGRELGTLAVLAYLAEGIGGLPVFQGHLAGIARFVGPFATTGGYLIGFPLAAFATGTLYRAGLDRNYGTRLVAVFLGSAVVFAGGALWLAAFFTHDLGSAFILGVLPFVVGDLAKCLVAAGLRPRRIG
jgi:biotin transport system substrate-specific component